MSPVSNGTTKEVSSLSGRAHTARPTQKDRYGVIGQLRHDALAPHLSSRVRANVWRVRSLAAGLAHGAHAKADRPPGRRRRPGSGRAAGHRRRCSWGSAGAAHLASADGAPSPAAPVHRDVSISFEPGGHPPNRAAAAIDLAGDRRRRGPASVVARACAWQGPAAEGARYPTRTSSPLSITVKLILPASPART
jgi:hypothetical protein